MSFKTFDTTNALSGMFLWLIFGYLTSLLNCDVKRIMTKHPMVLHMFAVIAFFFLFTVIDDSNVAPTGVIWTKTLIVYLLFLFMTKSKWYFVFPMLVLLLVDQTLKKSLAFERATNSPSLERQTKTVDQASKAINIAIIVMAVIGTLQYMYLQKIEYGPRFSLAKFMFGVTKCKRHMPNYRKMQ